MALVSWFEFICRALKSGREIVDPLAEIFSQTPVLRDEDPRTVVNSLLSITSIFGDDLRNHALIIQQVSDSLSALRE